MMESCINRIFGTKSILIYSWEITFSSSKTKLSHSLSMEYG